MGTALGSLRRLPVTGRPGRLPEVWASDVRILLLWEPEPTATDMGMVEEKLQGFNDRLYDLTDGQWRIARFLINDYRSWLRTISKGAGHLHRTDTHQGKGYAQGRPDDPEPWHVNETHGIGVYAMEFLHSWTGLKDEYEQYEDGEPRHCPEDSVVAQITSACVMDRGRSTELCRPDTHNPDTEQGNVRGMDCYSWLAEVMHSAGHTAFRVPGMHIPGPRVSPTVRFVYVTIQRIRQVDDPDPSLFQGAGDYFAKVRMAGAWLAPSTVASDSTDVSPGWFFGLAFSSDLHRTVPIHIEIHDEDDFSGDDFCDVSPVGGKSALDIAVDSGTGRITGDVAGFAGTPITVQGQGSDRVEMTFLVTTR